MGFVSLLGSSAWYLTAVISCGARFPTREGGGGAFCFCLFFFSFFSILPFVFLLSPSHFLWGGTSNWKRPNKFFLSLRQDYGKEEAEQECSIYSEYILTDTHPVLSCPQQLPTFPTNLPTNLPTYQPSQLPYHLHTHIRTLHTYVHAYIHTLHLRLCCHLAFFFSTHFLGWGLLFFFCTQMGWMGSFCPRGICVTGMAFFFLFRSLL